MSPALFYSQDFFGYLGPIVKTHNLVTSKSLNVFVYYGFAQISKNKLESMK